MISALYVGAFAIFNTHCPTRLSSEGLSVTLHLSQSVVPSRFRTRHHAVETFEFAQFGFDTLRLHVVGR